MGWLVQAPAKLNLYLDVLGRRSDGYHEIETLIVPIDLYDSLLLSPGVGEIGKESIVVHSCCDPAHREAFAAPAGPNNLVAKALQILQQYVGMAFPWRVALWKRIPMCAGMGGGSSDAAAALVAGNAAWQLGLNADELSRLGAQLGSDIPALLAGSAVIGRGRGEQLERCDTVHGLNAVVVRPPAGLSTAAVYAQCSPSQKIGSDIADLRLALSHGEWGNLRSLVTNALEAPAAALSPWIKGVLDAMNSLPFLTSRMTGSGSACFGLTNDWRTAQRCAAYLRGLGIGWVSAAKLL